MEPLDRRQVFPQRQRNRPGEHRDPVLGPLLLPDDDVAPLEIHILDPQALFSHPGGVALAVKEDVVLRPFDIRLLSTETVVLQADSGAEQTQKKGGPGSTAGAFLPVSMECIRECFCE